MTEPRIALVIPAAGAGARMGTRTPKQFLRIGRRSILEVTLGQFQAPPLVHEIVIALPEPHLPQARRLLGRHRPSHRPAPGLVVGGATRQESVWRALQALAREADIVVVHDGVRPFITRDLVRRVVRAAIAHGAAICALPIAETVKRVRGGVVEATLDRSELWAVQTPQAFRHPLLREAHEKALRDGFMGTDEAMLVERLGHPVHVVRGLESNIKVTTRADLRRVRGWIRR